MQKVQVLERRGLLFLLAAAFMDTLDFFIVNVAIPAMQHSLKASTAAILWIVAGYGFTYGCGLITGAKLGGTYGHRKILLLGLTLFTLASLTCGAAFNPTMLVVGRLTQGIGAALMVPQVLSLITRLLDGEARTKGFMAFGAALGLAAVFGQLLGGLLMTWNVFHLSWRLCFLVNVPIGLLACWFIPRTIPEILDTNTMKLDILGVMLATISIAGILVPLVQEQSLGWPVWCWISVAVGVGLFCIFIRHQIVRTARGAPRLIDIELLHDTSFIHGLIAQMIFSAGMGSFFLVLALYLQSGLHFSPLATGALFLYIGISYVAITLRSSGLIKQFGSRVVITGVLSMSLGYFFMYLITTTWRNPPIPLLGAVMVVIGLGMGCAFAPLSALVLAHVTPKYAVSASGIMTTVQQVGGAIGVAVLGSVFYHRLASMHSYSSAFGKSVLCLGLINILVAGIMARRNHISNN